MGQVGQVQHRAAKKVYDGELFHVSTKAIKVVKPQRKRLIGWIRKGVSPEDRCGVAAGFVDVVVVRLCLSSH